MPAATKPLDEIERLSALRSYDILDTPPEAAFDALAQLAANVCDVSIALISLVDEDRQWFKAKCGLTIDSTSRDVAFCAYAILGRGIFEVSDAAADPRFADNPLVTGEPYVRFYAGMPILDPLGLPLGTLCVMDNRPRSLTGAQRATVERLADAAAGLIATRARRLAADVQLLSLLDTALTAANERAAQLDMLADIARAIDSAQDDEAVIGTVLDVARRVCQAERAALGNDARDNGEWPAGGSPSTASAEIALQGGSTSLVIWRGEHQPFTHSERTLLAIIASMTALKRPRIALPV